MVRTTVEATKGVADGITEGIEFEGDATKASALRLWGKDIPVPESSTAASGSGQ